MTFAQVFDAWKEEHYKKIGPNGIEGYDGAFKIFAAAARPEVPGLKNGGFSGRTGLPICINPIALCPSISNS